jgi:hypothetical protein
VIKNEAPWWPGATTVLRVQESISGTDALTNWAARTAVETVFGGAYGTTEQAVVAGQQAITFARDRGTRVHYGIQAILEDEEHIPAPDTHPYWYGWSRFLVKERPDFLATERKVLGQGFGTTIDIVAGIRGKTAQVDVKSGSVKDTHVLQLAAGTLADRWADESGLGVERNRWHQYRPGQQPGAQPIPIETNFVLQLSPDGYELIELPVTKVEQEHFLFLVETYHRLKAWKNGQKEQEQAA